MCAVGEVYADNDLKNSDLALHEESLAKRRDVDARKSYEELAVMSKSSVSSVKSRLYRARENLRSLLLAGDHNVERK